MKHRHYAKEIKLSAIRDLQAGEPMAEVCRQYDTNAETIRRWRREHAKNPETAFSGKGITSTAEAKLAQSERYIGQLYAENQLLKKALEKLENWQAEQIRTRSLE